MDALFGRTGVELGAALRRRVHAHLFANNAATAPLHVAHSAIRALSVEEEDVEAEEKEKQQRQWLLEAGGDNGDRGLGGVGKGAPVSASPRIVDTDPRATPRSRKGRGTGGSSAGAVRSPRAAAELGAENEALREQLCTSILSPSAGGMGEESPLVVDGREPLREGELEL